MNLSGIRADIAEAMDDLGWSSWPYVPDDVGILPAAVVGVPLEINYALSLKLAEAKIDLTLYCNAGSLQDAQGRLDAAMSSSDVTGSVHGALATTTSSYWKQIKVTGAGNARLVSIGEGSALAVDIHLEVIG